MGADEFNEQRLPAVIHGRYQAVLIAPGYRQRNWHFDTWL